MNAVKRYELTMRNVEEVVTEDELKELLRTKSIPPLISASNLLDLYTWAGSLWLPRSRTW